MTFENYPEIKGGTRSKGYSWSYLEIDRLPASLYTDHGLMEGKSVFGARQSEPPDGDTG